MNARKENRFSFFEKDLDALIGLKKQEAELLGYTSHPYNALLNEFEKGCTVNLLDKTFSQVAPPLKELLDKISQQPPIDDGFLHQHYPKQQQWDFGMQILGQLGFDFAAGRQDISEHPFTTSFNCRDV